MVVYCYGEDDKDKDVQFDKHNRVALTSDSGHISPNDQFEDKDHFSSDDENSN